jgi:phage terminase large subunit-like protein
MNGRAGGNAFIIITKQASGTARVDALMAAFNAIALMAQSLGWCNRASF